MYSAASRNLSILNIDLFAYNEVLLPSVAFGSLGPTHTSDSRSVLQRRTSALKPSSKTTVWKIVLEVTQFERQAILQ